MQKYWSGLPFPSPGDLPDPGIKPGSSADSLPSEPPGKPIGLKWLKPNKKMIRCQCEFWVLGESLGNLFIASVMLWLLWIRTQECGELVASITALARWYFWTGVIFPGRWVGLCEYVTVMVLLSICYVPGAVSVWWGTARWDPCFSSSGRCWVGSSFISLKILWSAEWGTSPCLGVLWGLNEKVLWRLYKVLLFILSTLHPLHLWAVT